MCVMFLILNSKSLLLYSLFILESHLLLLIGVSLPTHTGLHTQCTREFDRTWKLQLVDAHCSQGFLRDKGQFPVLSLHWASLGGCHFSDCPIFTRSFRSLFPGKLCSGLLVMHDSVFAVHLHPGSNLPGTSHIQ